MIATSTEDIKGMRIAGKLASNVLNFIMSEVVAGVTTNQLNNRCHDFICYTQDATPAPLNYNGFPKSVCISVNNEVCHGIPSERKLKNGDIVNIDVTVIKNGYHGDTSRMFMIGEIDSSARLTCLVALRCLITGTALVKPGARLGDIGYAIQRYAESHGCSVVREYCGHGIGKVFHEFPNVLHYGEKDTGLELEQGMCFTIEPMINSYGADIVLMNDGWTVLTADGGVSAQYEHTLLVTNYGVEILTK